MGSGFFRRHVRSALEQVIIKTSGFGDRDRIDRTQSVDHVEAHQKRDAEPALLKSDLLQLIGLDRIISHHGAHSSGPDVILMVIPCGSCHDLSEFFLGDPAVCHHLDQFLEGDIKPAYDGGGLQIYLSDLLFKRHL